jgi:hypothetical protein
MAERGRSSSPHPVRVHAGVAWHGALLRACRGASGGQPDGGVLQDARECGGHGGARSAARALWSWALGCRTAAARGLAPPAPRVQPAGGRGAARGARSGGLRQRCGRITSRSRRAPRRTRAVLGGLLRRHAGRLRDDRRRGRRSGLHPALPVEAAHRRALPAPGVRHRDARPDRRVLPRPSGRRGADHERRPGRRQPDRLLRALRLRADRRGARRRGRASPHLR